MCIADVSATPLAVFNESCGSYMSCLCWPKLYIFHGKLSHLHLCLWQQMVEVLMDTSGDFQLHLLGAKPYIFQRKAISSYDCGNRRESLNTAQIQTSSQLPLSDHSVASCLTCWAEKLHWTYRFDMLPTPQERVRSALAWDAISQCNNSGWC